MLQRWRHSSGNWTALFQQMYLGWTRWPSSPFQPHDSMVLNLGLAPSALKRLLCLLWEGAGQGQVQGPCGGTEAHQNGCWQGQPTRELRPLWGGLGWWCSCRALTLTPGSGFPGPKDNR